MNLKAFDKITNKVLSMANNMPNTLKDAIKEHQETVLDLNKIQLESGLKNDNSKIIPPYKPSTVVKKKKQGKEFRWVTLEDKGDFKRGMKLNLRSEDMLIYSTDKKTENLKKKYTSAIFGLTSSSLQELRIELKPILIRKIRKSLRK